MRNPQRIRRDDGPVLKPEGYLIFRVENGRLQDYGLYGTRSAAEERIAGAGLSADWKIAAINCWFRSKAG
jgi:hypothetical protein